MLELKGIDFQLVDVLPGTQRIYLRLAGFRGGTVPALKLDGRRIQGTLRIARAVEQLRPQPPLFPTDSARRRHADEVERWGDEELQNVPRRILRWGLVHNVDLRRWLAEQSKLPLADLAARTGGLTARYYAYVIDADEATARSAVDALPQTLDRVDALLADETLTTDPPTAATLQVLCSVRALAAFSDLRGHVDARPSAAVARALFPEFPEPVPAFIPPEWLRGLASR